MNQLQLPKRLPKRRVQRRSSEPARLELTLELPWEMPRPDGDPSRVETSEPESSERGIAQVDFYI